MINPIPPSRLPKRFRLGLTCIGIALNAICASGALTLPLMSPALAARMKFTQPQLATIMLAGMVGQYPAAPLIGKVVDHYGPWLCSLVASVLFTFTFSLSALTYASTPPDIDHPSSLSFKVLAVCFGFAGLAQGCSYFSSLFTATKNFPGLISTVSAASMVMYGLSPMFLSFFATNVFTDPHSGLDLTKYFIFLALLGGTVNMYGAFVLTVPKSYMEETAEETGINETTSLLSGLREHDEDEEFEVTAVKEPEELPLADLLRDPYFWVLFVFMFLTIGCSDMVQANLGSITLSLPPDSPAVSKVPDEVSIATQVRILSIANAIARLLSGTLADILSPVARYVRSGIYCFAKKQRFSRILFLSFCTITLVFSFFCTEVAVRSRQTIWILSVGAGAVSGSVFDIVPGILSSIWGFKNLGRNFGVLAYAPFLGTPVFSLLYSYVAASHTDGGICQGIECWQLTFWINAACGLVAFSLSLLLWSKWKDRV